MNLYLAAPLFTQAERSWNLKLGALLAGAGHAVFLPQAEVLAIETLDAQEIFRVDIDGVRSSDAVVAVVDGADADSGTSFECGLAYALGTPIVLVRTDFRAGGGDALPGQKLATVNLMLAQAASAVVNLTSPLQSLDELAVQVIDAIEGLPDRLARLERLIP
jgi:nucleoside 2-deoxyribosyltransferase